MIAIAIGAVLLCGVLLYRQFVRTETTDTGDAVDVPSSSVGQSDRTVRLYSFFWSQTHSNADACFLFSFGAAQWNTEAVGHYLNCEFRTPDGDFIEYRDLPVPAEQWSELEATLRALSLPPYATPDPYLSDATDSRAEVCWSENGACFTDRYNGEYAHELYSFLMKLIGQIAH